MWVYRILWSDAARGLAIILRSVMNNNPNTYASKSAAAAASLQHYYHRDTGLYGDKLWWISATAVESLIDFMMLTGTDDYVDVISTTFDQAQNICADFLNCYFDDEGWWAITWIKAYEFTSPKTPTQAAKYLDMARAIFTDLENGWDDTCGGGTWWDKYGIVEGFGDCDTRNCKGAINNELFLIVAARLCRITGESAYLAWAQKEWDWFRQSGLISHSHLISNDLGKGDCTINPVTWTYNQGVILGGLVELYKIPGEEQLLSQAQSISVHCGCDHH